jgi:hypothetical protein
MKITAFAVVLGLGGLGGYALSAQQAPQKTAADGAVRPQTKVIRRTVHTKPKVSKAPAASGSGGSYIPPAASTATSGGSSVVSAPVSTGSSGGGGGGGGGGEHESEGGGDD